MKHLKRDALNLVAGGRENVVAKEEFCDNGSNNRKHLFDAYSPPRLYKLNPTIECDSGMIKGGGQCDYGQFH
jgi:hypothetical protein